MGTYGPLFADRVLHKGLDGFGSILFAAGAGSMASGILSATSSTHYSQRFIFTAAGLCGLLLMAVSYIFWTIPALFMFALLGFATILFMVNCNTAIQMASPLNTWEESWAFIPLYSLGAHHLVLSSSVQSLSTWEPL